MRDVSGGIDRFDNSRNLNPGNILRDITTIKLNKAGLGSIKLHYRHSDRVTIHKALHGTAQGGSSSARGGGSGDETYNAFGGYHFAVV